MNQRLRKVGIALSAAVVGVMAFAGNALATAYDMSSVTTGFGDQLTEAITTGLPVAGGILAFFVGWKVIRRVVKG